MRSAMQRFTALSFVLAALQLTGCQYRSKSDVYYLVASNLKLPYWTTVIAGFKDAASEYQVIFRSLL